MAGDKHPQWLPNDWIVVERKRCGRKRKFYIEPGTEREFNSMVKVIRYLEAKKGDEDHIIAEKEDHSQSSPTEAEGQSPTKNKEDAELTEQKPAESESKDGITAFLLGDDELFCKEHEGNTGTEVKEHDEIDIPADISLEDYLKDGCVDFSAEPSEDELWVMSWKDMYEILSRGCSCPPPTSAHR